MQVSAIGIMPNFANKKINKYNSYSQNFKGIGDIIGGFSSVPKVLSEMPIQFEKDKNLCQDVFNGTTLRPEVAKKLKEMAEVYRFCLFEKIKPVDLYIVGSMASYNYRPTSDIDLKLVLDYSKIVNVKDEKQVKLLDDDLFKTFVLFQAIRFDEINGRRIEVGTCPLTKIHTSGIYSVKQNRWLKSPNKFTPEIDLSKIQELPQYKYYKNELLKAIEKKDRVKIAKILEDLHIRRDKALKSKGENTTENLMYKKLRNEDDGNLFKNAYAIMLGYS